MTSASLPRGANIRRVSRTRIPAMIMFSASMRGESSAFIGWQARQHAFEIAQGFADLQAAWPSLNSRMERSWALVRLLTTEIAVRTSAFASKNRNSRMVSLR